MALILVARTLHDPATRTAGSLLGRFIMYSVGRGHRVVDVRGGSFTRRVFEYIVSALRPDLIVLEGHGGPESLGGYMDEIVLDIGNAGLLSGSLVYALSCNTASVLGRAAVSRDAVSYIGFEEEFVWVQERPGDPLLDRYARWFFRPVLDSLEVLADGGSAGLSYTTLVRGLGSSIEYWEGVDHPLSPLMMMFLLHDVSVSRVLGTRGARIGVPGIPEWVKKGVVAGAGALLSAALVKLG